MPYEETTPSSVPDEKKYPKATLWANVLLPQPGEKPYEIGGLPYTADASASDDRVIAFFKAAQAAMKDDPDSDGYITVLIKPNWLDGSEERTVRALPKPILGNPFA